MRALAGILGDGAAEAEGVVLPFAGTLVLHAGLDVRFQIKTQPTISKCRGSQQPLTLITLRRKRNNVEEIYMYLRFWTFLILQKKPVVLSTARKSNHISWKDQSSQLLSTNYLLHKDVSMCPCQGISP